jgi:2,4-dienoyl-CoA reductase-like NADH-dependent reductase (Old Yellow Enzyme family)/thioredoxin reductase
VFDHIFQPGHIGGMRLRNRLIMAPMVRNWAEASGASSARYEDHVRRVARGGVGAIVLEAAFVSPDGRGFVRQLGLHDDLVLPGLRRLACAAQAHGARIGIQLYHAGRQTSQAVAGVQPVAPSAIPCPLGQQMPRELTGADIARIVTCYADAAARAQAAGLDFVEIHGAHGYLITQFLSGFSNARTDRYGGSLDNRMRFLVEVFQAVRDRVGPEFPITVRLSGAEYTPGGISIAETIQTARVLQDLGADALHISACSYGSYATGRMISPMSVPDAPLAGLAEAVKAAVRIPVITVGKIRTPELAEELLAFGVADFVAMGRPLFADPDWPLKAEAGELAAINRCIACNEGCISRLFEQKDAWCLANPVTGREALFDVRRVETPRRVLVVGGGPGGVTAALWATRQGHDVTLYEKGPRLGGQLFAAAATPHRPGWDELRHKLAWDLAQSAVKLRMDLEVTREVIDHQRPDVVILATGALQRPASWPTAPGVRVWTGDEALLGPADVTGPVIVVGGGCAGAQTAEALADRGLDVTVVEARDAVAADAPLDDRALLMKRLSGLGVHILLGHRVLESGGGEVVVQSVEGVRRLPAASIVLCHGSLSENGLQNALAGYDGTVVAVGDGLWPRRVTEAILEGALAGLRLVQPDLAAEGAQTRPAELVAG